MRDTVSENIISFLLVVDFFSLFYVKSTNEKYDIESEKE